MIKIVNGIARPTPTIKPSTDIQFGFNDQQYKIGGQFHKTFYNLYAGHDGTVGIVVNSSDVRIICGNTHRMSLNDSPRFRCAGMTF